MNKEELIEFLKEQLKVELTVEDDGRFLKVKILLVDEIITEDIAHI